MKRKPTVHEQALAYIKQKNEYIINNTHYGKTCILDGLTIDGKLYSYIATITRDDRIYPMQRERKVKMDLLLEELELSSDEEGFA